MQALKSEPAPKTQQSVTYRLIVILVSTLAVFVIFLISFPFLFVFTYTLMGPIAFGDTESDARGFFDRVHDVFLAMYWYVRADGSLREGFYDNPQKFTDALLRTGVFQYPRLLPYDKTLNDKRIMIDDKIREFIGPVDTLQILTPVKAILSMAVNLSKTLRARMSRFITRLCQGLSRGFRRRGSSVFT